MQGMKSLIQSPTDPDFVQNPYSFYAAARARGPLQYWQDYGIMAAFSHQAVHALLRDKRLGRAMPSEDVATPAAHLAPFYAIEAHSMLELESPRHTRLRSLVLRAFTSRKIKALGPEIWQLSHDLIDAMPTGEFDILRSFCTPIPVIIIARLLGVPEAMAPDLLRWSNQMVAMYQANRTRPIEEAAAAAAADFAEFMRSYIDTRRTRPADDLITHLIAAEEDREDPHHVRDVQTAALVGVAADEEGGRRVVALPRRRRRQDLDGARAVRQAPDRDHSIAQVDALARGEDDRPHAWAGSGLLELGTDAESARLQAVVDCQADGHGPHEVVALFAGILPSGLCQFGDERVFDVAETGMVNRTEQHREIVGNDAASLHIDRTIAVHLADETAA